MGCFGRDFRPEDRARQRNGHPPPSHCSYEPAMSPIERKPIVFVVDDDADVRNGFKALLQSVDLDCEVFGSSEEFLRRKRTDTVSCLVLDIRMPGPSGLDLQMELAQAHL